MVRLAEKAHRQAVMCSLRCLFSFEKEVWLKKEKHSVFPLESRKRSPCWTLHTAFGFSVPGDAWEPLFFLILEFSLL